MTQPSKQIYCNNCGKPLKLVSRKPNYDWNTGKLLGHHNTFKCRRWWSLSCACYTVSTYEQLEEVSE